MDASRLPRVVLAPAAADFALPRWLDADRFQVRTAPLPVPAADLAECDVLVLNGSSDTAAVLQHCRKLDEAVSETGPPILFLAADPASRLAACEQGADACLSFPPDRQELTAQLVSLARWRQRQLRLRNRVAEAQHFSQRLQQSYKQVGLDLELARRLQTSFLPANLPEVGRVRFGVCYRPHGPVGGDFYDVFRLDEEHVGFYLADAMGHGLPASLLTIFLKRAVQGKEITSGGYRIVPPEEVLSRLNRELIELKLQDLPFVTMIYGVINCHDGRLRFSRAGHPYPVFIPRNGPLKTWECTGTLLGVFEAEFPAQEKALAPGDKLLLFTDGFDPGRQATHPKNAPPLIEQHRTKPVGQMVENLAFEVVSGIVQQDDFTLLALEFLSLLGQPGK